ncbi:MAG: sulfatase [Rikenellaceae bacterium]
MKRTMLMASCATGSFCCIQAAEQSPPNILLIVSDDHSLPHLGAMGSQNCLQFNLTPNIDKFAADAVLFTNAHSATPQSAPSRTAMFTGCSPLKTRTTRFGHAADAKFPLFTDLLKDAGYWVGMAGRGHHLNALFTENSAELKELAKAEERDIPSLNSNWNRVDMRHTRGANMTSIASRLDKMLNTVAPDQPFFLYYGITQPHRPFAEQHPDVDIAKVVMPLDFPDLPEVRKDYAQYLQTLKECDQVFESIVSELKRRGQYDNTVIIFMGDNGDALLRGKGTLYDRGTNVPLIIRDPRQKSQHRNVVSEDFVCGFDIAPTILDIAGVEHDVDMEGRSFSPVLSQSKYDKREFIYTLRGWHPNSVITEVNTFDMSRAVRYGDHLLIYNVLWDRPYVPVDMYKERSWEQIVESYKSGRLDKDLQRLYFYDLPRDVFELYNTKDDPYQMTNLFNQPNTKEIEQKLMDAMDVWMLRNYDYLPYPSTIKEKIAKYLNNFGVN